MARFFVGAGPEPGPIVLDRSRVYILPTPQGIALGLLVFAMVVGSLNFNNSPGLLVAFLLAGFGFVAILHTWSNLSGLAFRLGRVASAFAGEPVIFSLRADNPRGRPRFALRARRAGAKAGVFESFDVARAGGTVTLSVDTTRRGPLPLGRFTVETRYPVGLFRAWAHLEFERRALVYPRPGPPLPLPPSPGDRGDERGRAGRGDDEFGGVRAYVEGDALRSLHWKASARTGSLVVKQYEKSAGGTVWLEWCGLDEPGVEERLSRLCRWALDAHAAGTPWGLRLPGEELGPDRGDDHLHACLRALALFRP